jgi:phosphoglycolate phosphatase
MSLAGCALLFDLDGTLVDTAPDLAGTMNDLMAKLGYPPIPIATVRILVGRGARVLIEHGLAFHGHTASEHEIDQMFEAFIDIYATRIAQDSRPYPAVESVLDLLIAKGAKLAVVTNKPEGLAKLLLDALGLSPRFGTVIGYETAAQPKPHADPILLACERLGVPVKRALMVGDSATDVGAARAAGVPVILMRDGYTDTPPEQLGGDAVLPGYDQFAATAERLLGRG